MSEDKILKKKQDVYIRCITTEDPCQPQSEFCCIKSSAKCFFITLLCTSQCLHMMDVFQSISKSRVSAVAEGKKTEGLCYRVYTIVFLEKPECITSFLKKNPECIWRIQPSEKSCFLI